MAEKRMDQLLYTIPQCCRLAAIGRTKFYELVASGEIPIRKVGKKSLVAAADLKRWAERLPAIGVKSPEQSNSPPSEPPKEQRPAPRQR
jgi:excisionase family DNA binding protein